MQLLFSEVAFSFGFVAFWRHVRGRLPAHIYFFDTSFSCGQAQSDDSDYSNNFVGYDDRSGINIVGQRRVVFQGGNTEIYEAFKRILVFFGRSVESGSGFGGRLTIRSVVEKARSAERLGRAAE